MRLSPVFVAAGLVLGLTGCAAVRDSLGASAPSPPPSAAPSTGSAAAPSTGSPSEASAGSPSEASAGSSATPEPSPSRTPRAAAKRYSGSGDKLIPIERTGEIGLITAVAHGRGSFLVQSVGVSGDDAETLAHGYDDHRSTRLYNVEGEEDITALRVVAGGSWTITLKPVSAARTWRGTKVTGSGDDVLHLEKEAAGAETLRSRFAGDDYFAVEGYTEDDSSLLASEVGSCEVEEALPDGTFLVTVTGDGSWTLERTGPARFQMAAGLPGDRSAL
ncbi:hypothetical protein ACFFMN_37505 [Planobispora siamensis]|uniref:Lipoprotein n=1 Tax=Planobispora siamensis TaxID=936338 RepID=A0A8J3SDJ4_9ACTN|nr:hypothetical protein [Planobispora siamensis]GIH92681.1 hypothetical protein Psi01_33110 [Planobispora siamensis]